MGEFVRLEVEDGVGTIRIDRPKMNALDVQVQEEIRACAAEAATRDDVRAVIVYGGERVFAAGADVKEMADMSYARHGRPLGRPAVRLHRRRADSQAGGRSGHRLRPRRRLRARAVRRRPDRGGGRHARPARDPARRHPRRRRHPAAHPARRALPGQGHHLHRPVREGRRGAADRAGRPGRRRRRGVRRRPRPGPASSRRPRRSRCGPPRSPSTGASRSTWTPGWRSSGSSSPRCSPPRTARTGMRSFVESGPGKAEFTGPVRLGYRATNSSEGDAVAEAEKPDEKSESRADPGAERDTDKSTDTKAAPVAEKKQRKDRQTGKKVVAGTNAVRSRIASRGLAGRRRVRPVPGRGGAARRAEDEPGQRDRRAS